MSNVLCQIFGLLAVVILSIGLLATALLVLLPREKIYNRLGLILMKSWGGQVFERNCLSKLSLFLCYAYFAVCFAIFVFFSVWVLLGHFGFSCPNYVL